jgi:hypothetical protein
MCIVIMAMEVYIVRGENSKIFFFFFPDSLIIIFHVEVARVEFTYNLHYH